MASYSSHPQMLGFSLGVQSKSWQEQLAEKIYDETGDKKLISARWWVPGLNYWNTSLIDKLNRLSSDILLPGANRTVYMTANADVTEKIVNSFMKNIETYRGLEAEPGAAAVAAGVVKDVYTAVGTTAKGLGSGIGSTAKTIPLVLGILAAGVAGYLVFAGRKGTDLTSFLPAKRLMK